MDGKDINDSNGTYDKWKGDLTDKPMVKLRSSSIGSLCRYLKKGCNKTTNNAIETVHHGYFYATVVVGI